MEGTSTEVGSADGDLLDAARRLLGGDFIGQASRLLGETEGSTRSAVGILVPALLGMIAKKGATPEGARRLLDSISGLSSDVALPTNVTRLFGGSGAGARDLMSAGNGFVQTLLGSETSTLASTIASISRIRASSVATLLALTAPLLGGLLKRHTTEQRLDPRGLANLLSSQRGDLEDAVDRRLGGLLGLGGVAAKLGTAGRTAERSATGLGRWAPWLLGIAALVFLYPLLRPLLRGAEQTARNAVEATGDAAKRAVHSIGLPDGIKIDAPSGGFIDSLVASLAATTPLNAKGVAFDALTFTTASATLDASSNQQIDQLAIVLKAYPQAKISVEGHTDNAGDAAANLKLSQDRAAAVKAAAVARGVAADRITTAGYGQDRPIASNDTETGRAQNRRVELVLTAR